MRTVVRFAFLVVVAAALPSLIALAQDTPETAAAHVAELTKSRVSRSTSEDNGDLAKATTMAIKHGPYHLASRIGDGPHGSAGTGSGDYDFFRIPNLQASWILSVDTSALDLGSTLDSQIAVYNSLGTIIASNDDFNSLDSYVEVILPAAGDYYVAVMACCNFLSDPFDSSSGFGSASEGDYQLTVALHAVH